MNANQLTKIPVEKLSNTLRFLIAENEIPFSDALKQVIDDVDAVCKKLLRDESAPAQPVSEPYKLPDGWVMVPEEATIAMLTLLGLTGSFDFMQQKYKNMLAAAPAQESE